MGLRKGGRSYPLSVTHLPRRKQESLGSGISESLFTESSMDRRRFLQQLGVSAAALSLPVVHLDALAQAPPPPLDILILGGAALLGAGSGGRCAWPGGHPVTLFNRGKSAPDMYPRSGDHHWRS